jgi:hypothetical protein
MVLRLRQIAAVAAATTAVSLCACAATAGPAPPSITADATPSPAGVTGRQLTGTISLGGDYTISAAFEATAQVTTSTSPSAEVGASTCSTYARGATGTAGTAFVGPVVHTSTNPAVYLSSEVKFGYLGPGTYVGGSTPGLSAVAAITVPTSVGGAVQVYHPSSASVTTLIVHPDGSGLLTFSRWRTTEVRGGLIAGHLDGQVSWVCE